MHETPQYSIEPSQAVFLAVDIQRAFGEAVPVPGAEEAIANVRCALAAWRSTGGRVILTRHAYESKGEVGRLADFLPNIFDALHVDSPLSELHDGIYEDGDEIIRKTRFSAVLGTDLLARLETSGIETVIVAGLTTPICDQATVDSLSMQGFKVLVIGDACASQPVGSLSADEAHRAAVERMGYVFAEVVSTDEFVERCVATPMLNPTVTSR